MLVKNGHNTELFNPFNYPLNKLTHFHNLLSIDENIFLLKQHTLYRALQQIINSSQKTKHEADRNYKKLLEEMQKWWGVIIT